jgi:hypothetical protein
MTDVIRSLQQQTLKFEAARLFGKDVQDVLDQSKTLANLEALESEVSFPSLESLIVI